MITLRQLTLQRGAKPLLQQTNLTVYAGQKVGLVGANGCGKSSVFALLRGILQADSGDLELPARLTIAHVAQETPAVNTSALDYVLDGDTELRDIERQLTQAEAEQKDGMILARLHEQFDAIDGYSARARAAQLLDGLGFSALEIERSVKTFSGGWRMRLNLAQALMCRSDLLLLDEPTNHLDLDAVLWLEQWLSRYAGTLLLIAHDRDFLDSVVDSIAHIERQQITLYSGHYSAFERQRAEHLAQQQAAYEQQQREIAHMQRFVDRFRAKASKAKQAQSRLKALSRMEEIAPAHIDSPFHFAFPETPKAFSTLLDIQAADLGYGDKTVLTNVNLQIQPGARIGLLGPNGAGKSTLIRLLAGEMAPKQGEIVNGPHLHTGYFAQHQLEQLREDWTPLKHVQQLSPQTGEQDIRNFLGGFGFNGDMATASVKPFSGGERARLALALLVWQKPNLLLLDEPTNHLDLEMRYALTVALQAYEGAMVIVSHDRHLLRTTTDQWLLVADRHVRVFDDDLEAYRQWLLDYRAGQREATTESSQTAPKADTARLHAQRKPLQNRLKQLDRQLEKLSADKVAAERLLSDPAVYDDQPALQRCLQQQMALAEQLVQVEEEWLNVTEQLESMI